MATTMTSREFNQGAGRAKRATEHGQVFITDRGRPVHVLLSMEEYQRSAGACTGRSTLEAFAQPGGPEYDFDVEILRSRELPRKVDPGFD